MVFEGTIFEYEAPMIQYPLHLSASSIKTYLTCPRKYDLSYVSRLEPAADSSALVAGTAWHRAMELEAMWGDTSGAFDTIRDEYERAKMSALFKAYCNVYAEDPLGVTKCEVPFEFSLTDRIKIVGRLDGLIKIGDSDVWHIPEYKTTSQSIDGSSSLWNDLRVSPQVSIYMLAAGELGYTIEGLTYDVSRKPALRPSALRKAQSELLFSQAMYCGQTFPAGEVSTAIEAGKETPALFAARIYETVMTDPGSYFARVNIPFIAFDQKRIREELIQTCEAIDVTTHVGALHPNYSQCNNYGSCIFHNICHNPVNRQAWRAGDVPRGYRSKPVRERAKDEPVGPSGAA
jgi:hypothetical protein